MNTKFIEFLKKQIGNKSLGQIEIQTGVPKSTISYVLRGLRDTPKPETLKKLAKALPCSFDELMEAAGYIEPKPKTPPKLYTMAVLGRGGNIEEIEFTEEEIEAFKTLFKEKFNKGKNINE